MTYAGLGWLPWRSAVILAAALGATALVLYVVRRRSGRPLPRVESAVVLMRETALILALYAVWQYVAMWSHTGHDGADAAGLWLAELEGTLRWPSEAALQQQVLGNDTVVRAADLYYSSLHIPVFVLTLVWVLLFRRGVWPFARTMVSLLTGLCLLIQFKPVAPPRLLPQLGIVDTAAANGLSVYGLVPGANEYSAMPSVHIAWAAAVALIVIVAIRSRWRWLVLLYPVLTLWVVVVTGNHFIIDGVAALALLGVAVGITWLFPSQRPPSSQPAPGQVTGTSQPAGGGLTHDRAAHHP
jgi:hypothetical protein